MGFLMDTSSFPIYLYKNKKDMKNKEIVIRNYHGILSKKVTIIIRRYNKIILYICWNKKVI